jgi:HD-GYP domain-containing protein (c-di-GMP phosphodiesterase class II)
LLASKPFACKNLDMTANSKKQPHDVSIRFLATTIILAVGGLVSAILIALMLYFDKQLAEQSAVDQFIAISQRSVEKVATLGDRGEQLATALVNIQGVEVRPGRQEIHPMVMPMTRLMRPNDSIFALFTGYPDGSYLEVSNLDAAPGLRAAWNAEPGDRWVVVRIFELEGRRIEERLFLDAGLKLRTQQVHDSGYYANQRPWFSQAPENGMFITAPYELNLVKRHGLSFVTKHRNGAVTGAIVLLSSLDAVIQNQKFPRTSQSLIFNSGGFIFAAHPPMEQNEHSETLLEKLALLPAKRDRLILDQLHHIDLDGEPYLAYIKAIPNPTDRADTDYIAQLVHKGEITEQYQQRLVWILLASLGTVLLLVPFVLVAVKPLANPIRELALENDKVRRREYDSVAQVDTRIREVRQLSTSLVGMSAAIRDYERQQKELRDAMVELIAQAIDQKSPYTGGHCERVPVIALALAKAASEDQSGSFRDFSFSQEEEWLTFRMAAWLHDCGKITTPEYIVDKGSKLETIYNRIHEIRMRFEVMLRDAEIEFWEAMVKDPGKETELRTRLEQQQEQIRDDFAFIAECNIGGEFMDEPRKERLRQVAARSWVRQLDNRRGLSPVEMEHLKDFPTVTPQREQALDDKTEHILYRKNGESRFAEFGFTMQPSDIERNLGEIYNLSVERGTLTAEERYIINEHISTTIKMLETLPWPDELRHVPEYAGAHHEKIDGSGYPRGLTGEQMSVPARIMAIADIFEALTAADRPYKKAKTLSESLKIMHFMARDSHIDKQLFILFIRSRVYLDYARQFLDEAQIDTVDENAILSGL